MSTIVLDISCSVFSTYLIVNTFFKSSTPEEKWVVDVFVHVLGNRHSKNFMQNIGPQFQEKNSVSLSIFASR